MNWAMLRQQVTSSLNLEELRTLCFDLEIDYDSLPGEGKEAKVRELMALMKRNKAVPRLVRYLNKLYPQVQWDVVYKEESETLQITDSDEEDEGVLDYALTIEEAGDRLVVLMNDVGKAVELLSNKLQVETERLQSTPSKDFRKAHNIASRIASDHENFAAEIDKITLETTELWRTFRSAYRPFFVLESEDLRNWLSISQNQSTYISQVVKSRITFVSVATKIHNLWLRVKSARSTLSNLRGLSRNLNKAIRKTETALSKYLDILNEVKEDLDQLSDLAAG